MDSASVLGYSNAMSSLLVVGCDSASRFCIERAASVRGFRVEVCRSLDEARGRREAPRVAAALIDANCFARSAPGNGALGSVVREFPYVVVVCALHRLAEVANSGVFATLTTPFSLADVDRVLTKIGPPTTAIPWDAERSVVVDGASGEGAGLDFALQEAVDRQLAAWGDAQPAEIYEFFVRALERPLIARMLELTRGNQVVTAARLGLNRNTLRKKLKYLGLLKVHTP
ncbi:MAG: hypothetical protein HYY84_07850 [Deltaproteobacteria bacterium]|nr:hypothetical protein [Deltaproteobacteria bacterium]